MTPKEAEDLIAAAANHPAARGETSFRSAWKEITAASGFAAVFSSALVAAGVIESTTQGVVLIFFIICAFGLIFGGFLTWKVRKKYAKVRPSIHLDQGSVGNTIDSHLEDFVPDADILILQTWIPDNQEDRDDASGKSRLDKWQKSLREAIVKHREQANQIVRLRVLLLGSEEILRNRVRFRVDLAQQIGEKYPLQGESLDAVVKDAKARIDRAHTALLALEKDVNSYLREKKMLSELRVSIRYYRIMPSGPLYIFGKQALLAGFYDHRWTSDRAPIFRLDTPKSAEWEHFRTQFECIWGLKDPRPSGQASLDSATTVFTTKSPSWRGSHSGRENE